MGGGWDSIKTMRGPAFTADPRRGTLSFVTQKFFCFGAINNRRNDWLGIPFCCHMKRVEHLNQQGFTPASSLYQSRLWCDRNCYKYILSRLRSGVGSAGDLNSNDVQAHAMIVSQSTVGDADGTGISVVQSGVISETIFNLAHIIINLQTTNIAIQSLSNLLNSGIFANEAINCKQHGHNFVSNIASIYRNQISESSLNIHCVHIISSHRQITSRNTSGRYKARSQVDVARRIKVRNGTNITSSTDSGGEVDNSSAANVLSSSVQSSLQIIAVAHGNLNIGQIAQSGFKHCRLTSCRSSSRGGSRILGLLRSSVASGQHADSHDASQSQRSNLLEFHNDFFLLMVYKR